MRTFTAIARFVFFAAFLSVTSQPSPSYAVTPAQGAGGGVAQTVRAEYVPGEVLVKFKKGVKASEKKQFHTEAETEVLSEIPELGVERVKSKKGESTEALLKKYKKNLNVEYVEPNGFFYTHSHNAPNDPYFLPYLYGLN